MRSSNSIKNAVVATIMNIITILVGFLVQKIFVISLGNEYLGLNGLFSNILSILAVVELGFGSAIIYHLYKPVAEHNEKEITILMRFYKKTYRIIASIIFVLGLSVMPFMKYIVGEITISENLYLLFLLALIDIVASYLLTYKRSILYADQKTYIINLVHIGYIVLMNICEVTLLLLTKNYLLYLMIKIVFRLLENIVISVIANKKYPFILDKVNENISSELRLDILHKVKGLLFHRIGGSLVLGTDNIIISNAIGVIAVGLYSNYSMIINALTNLLGQVFNSIIATIGNLLIENDRNKSFDIYHKMLFLNSWLYCFCGTCLLCLLQPFITLWMGQEYLLPYGVIIVLIINFYIQGMRATSNTFKEAAGIFYEDRFVPIIESVINIVASIILAKMFGLIGIFIGTSLSSMVLFLYSYPIFVYKKLFHRRYAEFIREHLKYFIISIIVTAITAIITSKINISNLFITLFINAIICIVVPNIFYVILFYRTNEFKYYIGILKTTLKKITKNY
ncbi:MAG: polysaccharide biosynthesis C-terminal domain-containing protein [Clostridia bacterium]|nr:polysaccharide biosynthesis C-terminal domain-containing protein [Clostridia bacterium]